MSQKQPIHSPARLYTIRDNGCCNYVAGVSAEGEQVLMGVAPGRHFVAAFFDQVGRFLRDEIREVSNDSMQGVSPAKHDEQQVDAVWRALRAWEVEIGLVAGEIRIAGFSLPKWDEWGAGIGVFDLPQFMQDCADDPSSEANEQFRQELLDDIKRFRSNGKYVLRWGTEYWMSKEGEITDT